MIRFRSIVLAPLTLGLLLSSAPAQRGIEPRAQAPRSRLPDERSSVDVEMQQRMKLDRNRKRMEEMKRDSQKLVEMATELKQSVDRAGENMLSLDVVKKAEATEKLARRIKNNMREQ